MSVCSPPPPPHTHTYYSHTALDFDREIISEMGQLGILGPTIEGT